MGSLGLFRRFLDDCHDRLQQTEQRLCALQAKYETFFAEIDRVRESELCQLTAAILADRSAAPAALCAELDRALAREQAEFDRKLAELEQRRTALEQEAEQQRSESLEHEGRLRQANRRLDGREEALKARNTELLSGIERYNRRIRELGRGFGFFRNLFRMRSLAAERRRLDEEQADVAARIDALRQRWRQADSDFARREDERKRLWLARTTEAAELQAKVEALRESEPRIVQRGAFEKVLFARQPELAEPRAGDPPCPRCAQPNPTDHHFCHICALRLGDDRPDLAGSLEEIAEVNLHHQRFAEGLQACQEIIGLVRGLQSGLVNFTRSVIEMATAERVHNLERLAIDVPGPSLEYARSFEQLAALVAGEGTSRHPRELAGRVRGFLDEVFTEQRIQAFFETMGQELSRQADRQW